MSNVVARWAYDAWRLLVVSALLLSFARNAVAVEELPAEIPQRRVNASEALQEIVKVVEEIERLHERKHALTLVLYDLNALDKSAVATVAKCWEHVLFELRDPASFASTVEVIAYISPEAMKQLAGRIDDSAVRDQCLRAFVGGNPERNPSELLPLVREIQDPRPKAAAWASMVRNRHTDLATAKTYLNEARKLDDMEQAAGGIYALGMVMSRFAKVDADAVGQYLSEVLPPDKAVVASGNAATYADFQYKSPEASARLLQIAGNLVPRCADPAAATEALLHNWLAKHHPHLALELFDQHLESNIKQTPDNAFSYLWPAGLAATLDRAERFCAKRDIPREGIVSRTLGRIASFDRPELTMDWLANAPPSRLRDESTVEIISGFIYRPTKQQVNREEAEHWVEYATRHTLAVEDKALRRKACERLSALICSWSHDPPIPQPEAISPDFSLRMKNGRPS